MTKQQPAPTPPAFYGSGREFVFQVGQQQEVVVAGNRPSTKTMPGQNWSPSLYCAVIVKRVDAQTRAKTGINELLRD